MKYLILLTLAILASCGKSRPTNQVASPTKEVRNCSDLTNLNLDGKTLNVTSKPQYEVTILTVNADCSYQLDYKVYFSVTLNQKSYCTNKGTIEEKDNRINFKPSNNVCDSSEVDNNLSVGGRSGNQFKSELEADKMKVLSCNKVSLTSCELR